MLKALFSTRFRRTLFAVATSSLGLSFAQQVLANEVIFATQNWDQATREAYYFTPQGSNIMPNVWFKALEHDGGGLFSDPNFLVRFGLIPPNGPSPLNPNGYPIGIVVGPSEGSVPHMGLTCAACHTGEVAVSGHRVRIDGGAARFDLDAFYAALSEAVTATARSEDLFIRFAARVLGEGADAAEVEALRSALTVFQIDMQGDAELRAPRLYSGFGRVDALTQSVNALAVRDQATIANIVPVDAPVSYPPLWLTPELEFVQYSPIAASPIARNSGQVLAVFGSADLTPGSAEPFASTILVRNLNLIEKWISDLEPPAWDEELMGPIDTALAETGRQLFAQHCASCHNMVPYERTDPDDNAFGRTFIRIGRVDYRDIGTDSVYFDALLPRRVRTNEVTAPLFGRADTVPAAIFFLGTVGKVVEVALDDLGVEGEEKLRLHGHRFRRDGSGVLQSYKPPSLTDFKAGPLAGVWATGPYLHNGSVPTIYELLSPEWDRRDVFFTGDTTLDRTRLGFVSDEKLGLFRFDTSLPGNHNGGHVYPRGGLDHGERMALIEYLKTK